MDKCYRGAASACRGCASVKNSRFFDNFFIRILSRSVIIASPRLRLGKNMSYHHIYNRGAHKAPIFYEKADYIRMLKLLYIANNSEPFRLRNLGESNIFEVARKNTLVDIVCYCLMPNHIHIALKPKTELENDPNITKFMHKLCTAYSMYFNLRYDHSGTIWESGFKKKISDQDLEYMKTLINYIHLNPYGIKEPSMTKDERKEHPVEAFEFSKNYDFSSFKDYLADEDRPQKSILCQEEVKIWLNAEAAPRQFRGLTSGNN